MSMEFKDRRDAAVKLYELLKKEKYVNEKAVVVSLLRGGTIIGDYLASKLKAKHYPLVSVKISSPYNPELAIGAICFDVTHVNTKIINTLNFSNSQITKQIKDSEKKMALYCTRFNIEEKKFNNLRDKVVVLTDDGVATGSTLITALEFVKSKKPYKIILALPITPGNFSVKGVDKTIIVYKDPALSAISQYYKYFPQVEDEQIKSLKSLKKNPKSKISNNK